MNGFVRCNCAMLMPLLVASPGLRQLAQAIGPIIGMTDAALESIHLAPMSELIVGIYQAIAERIRIGGDRACQSQPTELVLAKRVGVQDLVNRVRLAHPFTNELAAGRRRERQRTQQRRREPVDVELAIAKTPQGSRRRSRAMQPTPIPMNIVIVTLPPMTHERLADGMLARNQTPKNGISTIGARNIEAPDRSARAVPRGRPAPDMLITTQAARAAIAIAATVR